MGSGAGYGLSFGNTRGTHYFPGDTSFMDPNDDFARGIEKRRLKDYKGRFDVVAHGNEMAIEVTHNGRKITVDSRVAARLIKERGYKKGQPVKLLSCNTGKLDAGFAQNLANKLGVTVLAPTKYVWTDERGNCFVADRRYDTEEMVPDRTKLGRFKAFNPKRSKK